MTDHQSASDRAASVETESEGLRLDRREVLTGIAAGIAVGASTTRVEAAADPNQPSIRIIRNPDRHDEFGVGIELVPKGQDKLMVALYPRLFGDLRKLGARSVPIGYRTENNRSVADVIGLDRFDFPDVIFSDRSKYSLSFRIDASQDPVKIFAMLGSAPGGQPRESSHVDLAAFLRGEKELQFELDFEAAENFRWVIFGERLEVEGPGAWLTLRFADLARRPGYSEWSEPRLELELKPKEGAKIWAIEGTVTVRKLLIRKVEGNEGDGAYIQEQQELRDGFNDKGQSTEQYRSDAWIGEAEGDPVEAKSNLKWDRRSGPKSRIAKKSKPLRRYQIGQVDLPRKKPAVEIVQLAQPTRLTLRQWGRARKTLAMLRAQFSVTILSPGKTEKDTPPPVVFPLADAILTRQDLSDERAPRRGEEPDRKVEETLTGRLTDKPFAVETDYGTFVVEGDPPPSSEAGKSAKAANPTAAPGQGNSAKDGKEPKPNPLGIRLERRNEFAGRPAKGLTQLNLRAVRDEVYLCDVRARLRQIAFSLPNSTKRDDRLEEDARVWSRIDFGGTEIAFRLPLPEITDQTWPSARGIVTIGEEPRGFEGLAKQSSPGKIVIPPVLIALDGARLNARRDSDNFALMFQFARMALELGKDGGRIVPNLRLSGAGAGQSRGAAGKDALPFDDRSLLIVNFPPQHVAEKVYYRRVNDGVSLPDVPGGIKADAAFADQVRAWRAIPLNEEQKKLEARKAIFEAQRGKVDTILGNSSDSLHEQVKRSRIKELYDLLDPEGGPEKWQDKVGDKKAALLDRWLGVPRNPSAGAQNDQRAALPKDQRAYYLGISADAMDPDVRKVWIDIWRAYCEDSALLPDVPSSILGDPAFAQILKKMAGMSPGDADRIRLRKETFEAETARLDKIGEDHPLNDQLNRSRLRELVRLLDPAGKPDKWLAAIDPTERDALRERWKGLPEDQRAYYLGPADNVMSSETRLVWQDIWRAYRKKNPKAGSPAELAFLEAVQALPDVSLPQSVLNDIKSRLPAATATNEAENAERLQLALSLEKSKRSDDFAYLAEVYWKRLNDRTVPEPLANSMKVYSGPDDIRRISDGVTDDTGRIALLKFVRELAGIIAAYQFDSFKAITPARLSGPSRLVFRFEASGGSFDDKDLGKRSELGEEKESVRSIDLSFEGLTDWGRFDLAVTRRAETLEMMPGGRVPHPDFRGFDLDPAKILAHQRIRAGRSVEARMGDIKKTLHAPEEDRTAIELPFRLVLSPDQFGRFRTRRTIATEVLRARSGGGAAPKSLSIAPVLWSANLQIGETTPTVRAIWSDDFRPGAFDMNGIAPPRGPWAPWQVPPWEDQQPAIFRTALDAYDRHEIVALSSVYGLPVMGRRNELDNLVDGSQFEPPKEYRLENLKTYQKQTSDAFADLSGIYNPSPLNISELRLTAIGGSLRHDTSFTPPAGAVLRNDKNLFEALSVERWRQITVLGRDIEVEVVYKGFLFPLGIRASLVKLTERRFLRNNENGFVTAFLIQRQFIRIGKPTKNFPAIGQPDKSRRFPVSELTMLTRETPDIVDPAVPGRPTPRSLSDKDDLFLGLHPNGRLDFSPTKELDNESRLGGLCFWPRTRPGPGGNIYFEFRLEGDATPVRMPMVFVDNRAANNPKVVAALATYYNWDKGDLKPEIVPLRTVGIGGARRRYADENKDGECEFETYSWIINAEGRQSLVANAEDTPNGYYAFDPLLQGNDQPPFYPYVALANIRIGQAERFVGRTLPPVDVKYPETYRVAGFPSAAEAAKKDGPQRDEYYVSYLERYLELIDKLSLDMGDGGDRSGGIGRPAMNLKFLSRRFGLMPAEAPKVTSLPAAPPPPDNGTDDAQVEEPPAPPFDLKSFFSGEAKLLGIITFQELIEYALRAAGGSAMPALKEQIESATAETAEFLRQSVLPEIERALKSLEEMWQAAQKALSSASGATRIVAPLEIDKIYPDIAPALHDLIVKVQRARSASNLELVGAMTAVQASGRKFVTAINRTLADPVAPLREDLRSKFRLLSDQIQVFSEGLAGVARQAIIGLRNQLINAARTATVTNLRAHKPDIKPFTRLVLALPVPAPLPVLDVEQAKQQVGDQLDNALVEGAIAFVDSILTKGSLSDEAMNVALEAGLKAAHAQLEGLDSVAAGLHEQAKAALAAYQAEAKALLDKLKGATGKAKEEVIRQLRRQVPGVLHPILFGPGGIVEQLSKEAQQLEGIQVDRNVLEVVALHIANALKNTARLLVEQQAKTLCKDLAEKIAQLSNKLLPPADGAAKSIDGLVKAVNALADAVSVTKLSETEAITRYGQLRKTLTDGLIADACVDDNARSAISASVAKVMQELIGLQQAINAAVLATIQDCERKLEAARQTAADTAVHGDDGRWENFLRMLRSAGRTVSNFFELITGSHDVDDLVQLVAAQLAVCVGAGTDEALDALQRLKAAIPANPVEDTAINRALSEQLDQLRAGIDDTAVVLRKTAEMIKFVADLPKNATDPTSRMRMLLAVLGSAGKTEQDALTQRLAASRSKLLEQFSAQRQIVERGILAAIAGAEDRLMSLLGEALAARDAAKAAAVATVGRVARPVFQALRKEIYARVDTLRVDGRKALAPDNNASALARIITAILKTLRGPNGEPLSDLFSVPPIVSATPPATGSTDQLDRDLALLDRLTAADPDPNTYVRDLVTLAEDWKKGRASPLLLVRNIGYVLTAVLKGDLAQFVDLKQIRRQVDQAIRTMVPARISRSYDVKLKLSNLGSLLMFDGKTGLPRQHPKGLPGTLVLHATGIVDVLQPKNSTFEAEGYMPGFALQLLPAFDVVTFFFPPPTFKGGLGKPLHVSLKIDDVELGSKVQFLKQIQSILPAPKNGNGFFMRMMSGRGSLGIVAGYALPISPITIGNMFIDNLSLNAAAELPFDSGDARFVISVSRPEAPFMIAVAPYAGCGHFGLIANSKGIIGFEASFQFGGGGGFSFGPLTGKGRIAVGIYIRKISGLTELYGLFYAGGSARIACFGVGAQLNVRMSQKGGDAEGEAIFTYSFSIGVKDIEFSVPVFKREKGSGGGGSSSGAVDQDKVIDLASHEYREVFAAEGAPLALLVNDTRCKGEDFRAYRKYFSRRDALAPGRSKPAAGAKPTGNIWVMR